MQTWLLRLAAPFLVALPYGCSDDPVPLTPQADSGHPVPESGPLADTGTPADFDALPERDAVSDGDSGSLADSEASADAPISSEASTDAQPIVTCSYQTAGTRYSICGSAGGGIVGASGSKYSVLGSVGGPQMWVGTRYQIVGGAIP